VLPRLATLVISLILMLIAGIQSCAVAAGVSIAEDLSTAAKDKQEAEELAGAGGAGVIAALMWLVAAGLVMTKPRASMWIFGVASLLWLIAGAAGFSDGFIWMVASLIFAAMSWRGIRELEEKEQEGRARYQADVATAAAGMQRQPGPPARPPSQPPPPPEQAPWSDRWRPPPR